VSGTYDLPFGEQGDHEERQSRGGLRGRRLENVNLITTFTTGTALGWANVIYLADPSIWTRTTWNNSFDTSQFNASARKNSSSTCVPFRHVSRTFGRTRYNRWISRHQGIPHHRADEDDLSLRVL